MYARSEILNILNDEYALTNKFLNKVGGRYNGDQTYNVMSSSNECLELLLCSIEHESKKPIQRDIYVVHVTYNNQIVMVIGCFPNVNYKFQLNNFITKFINKQCPKNISMYLHSYTASLFGSEFIIVKQPLEHMKHILLTSVPANIIDTDSHDTIKDYELKHEHLIGCPYKEICYHGIGNYQESLIIKVTDELKNLHHQCTDLIFGYTKMTNIQ